MSKNLIWKQDQIKQRVKANVVKRKDLKAEIIRSRMANVESTVMFKLQQKLSSFRRISSPIRFRRVCQVTGRSRGYYRFFGLSRREIVRNWCRGYLAGLRKSSW